MSVFLILPASSIVLPFSPSVARLDDAIALPPPRGLGRPASPAALPPPPSSLDQTSGSVTDSSPSASSVLNVPSAQLRMCTSGTTDSGLPSASSSPNTKKELGSQASRRTRLRSLNRGIFWPWTTIHLAGWFAISSVVASLTNCPCDTLLQERSGKERVARPSDASLSWATLRGGRCRRQCRRRGRWRRLARPTRPRG